MGKIQKRITLIFLIVNILIIAALSSFAYYGKHIDDYLDADYIGRCLSIDGIDTDISFFDLLRLRLFPNSFNIDEANRIAIANINHNKPYDNHKFTIYINWRSSRAAKITVKQDKDRMNGVIELYSNDKRVQNNEFYIAIEEQEAIVRINHCDVWYETTVSSKMFTDYEITNLINELTKSQFETFPRKGDQQAWIVLPKNSFIKEIDFTEDGRLRRIDLTLPDYAYINSFFGAIDSNPENIKMQYLDSGNCGHVVIDEPNWSELEIRKVDDFSMLFPKSNISQGLELTLNGDLKSYSVTGISDRAITNSIIPSEYNNLPITVIGVRAFSNCTSLTNVTIGANVTAIGDYAFEFCSSLTSVTIPDSVTRIGDAAFSLCDSMESVTIPDSVITIGHFVFYGCTNLAKIYFEGTIAQWNEIGKDADWNKNIATSTIICSDGTVSIK